MVSSLNTHHPIFFIIIFILSIYLFIYFIYYFFITTRYMYFQSLSMPASLTVLRYSRFIWSALPLDVPFSVKTSWVLSSHLLGVGVANRITFLLGVHRVWAPSGEVETKFKGMKALYSNDVGFFQRIFIWLI